MLYSSTYERCSQGKIPRNRRAPGGCIWRDTDVGYTARGCISTPRLVENPKLCYSAPLNTKTSSSDGIVPTLSRGSSRQIMSYSPALSC